MESAPNTTDTAGLARPRSFVAVLKRYSVSPGRQVVILIADSYKTSGDPYAPAAWWSPSGELGILLQSTSAPEHVTRLLSLAGNPWEGCLAVVETATSQQVVISCKLGSSQPAKKVKISIDAPKSNASVSSFDPAPTGYVQ